MKYKMEKDLVSTHNVFFYIHHHYFKMYKPKMKLRII